MSDLAEIEVTAPYPGLRPFEARETSIFYGRETHIDRLLEILKRERLLVVIGASGCGKSSLVKAGLLPALPADWIGTGSDWRIAEFRPGERPLGRLARALLRPGVLGAELSESMSPTPSEADSAPMSLIEAELRRGPLGLLHLVEDVARRGPEPFNLLVLVDQFEEVFRYRDRGSSQADEAEAFVNLLLESVRGAPDCVFVAITMRTDFLGDCARFLDLPEAINRAQYLVPRLSRAQLEAAISEPARAFGAEVEPELVNEMINSVFNDPDQLPVLQHALSRMWQKLTAEPQAVRILTRPHLTEVGGLARALSQHADEVLESLTEDQQRLAEHVFRFITERGTAEGGQGDRRRPRPMSDIAGAANRPWQDFVPVIEAFSREGVNFLIVAPPPLTDDSRVDISHEALIRQWLRLKQWVESEFERAAEYRRWRDRAIEWATKEGALLQGSDLFRAMAWLVGTQQWEPNEGWAVRYRADLSSMASPFALTMTFLENSAREAKVREEVERERERLLIEREQRRLEAESTAAEARVDAALARSETDRLAREKAEAAAREARQREQRAKAVALQEARLRRRIEALQALWRDSQVDHNVRAARRSRKKRSTRPGAETFFGLLPDDDIVLVAGCGENESGSEIFVANRYHGAFSYNFQTALLAPSSDLNRNDEISVHEAFIATTAALRKRAFAQHPLIAGGDLNVALFTCSTLSLAKRPVRRVRALLVGVNKYKIPGADLRGCVNDILGFKALLQKRQRLLADEIEVNVIKDRNATSSNIRAAIKSLRVGARASDIVIFYFSGHVSHLPSGGGRVRIVCPHDLDWERPLLFPDIVAQLRKVRAAQRILVVE